MTAFQQSIQNENLQSENPHCAQKRKRSWIYFCIIAFFLIVITFLLARTAGIKSGQENARIKIEANCNTTEGPESLRP